LAALPAPKTTVHYVSIEQIQALEESLSNMRWEQEAKAQEDVQMQDEGDRKKAEEAEKELVRRREDLVKS
jgi:hypothetical protein